MSTITSPRPSTPSLQTPSSSRRTSFDTITRSQGTSPARAPQPNQRRNRAALRDYYGLKNAAPADVASGMQHDDADVKESELDRGGFDAEKYVREVLERESLEGVLRVEAGLISEIRGLDGERKALVYDNYSKLITATDTIRKMRMNMDPLTPTTSTLSPAISHVAETAASLARSLQERTALSQDTQHAASSNTDPQEKQQRLVRWVLDAPPRLSAMVEEGKKDEAEAQSKEVSLLLDKWKGVQGVDEVRRQCEEALKRKRISSDIRS